MQHAPSARHVDGPFIHRSPHDRPRRESEQRLRERERERERERDHGEDDESEQCLPTPSQPDNELGRQAVLQARLTVTRQLNHKSSRRVTACAQDGRAIFACLLPACACARCPSHTTGSFAQCRRCCHTHLVHVQSAFDFLSLDRVLGEEHRIVRAHGRRTGGGSSLLKPVNRLAQLLLLGCYLLDLQACALVMTREAAHPTHPYATTHTSLDTLTPHTHTLQPTPASTQQVILRVSRVGREARQVEVRRLYPHSHDSPKCTSSPEVGVGWWNRHQPPEKHFSANVSLHGSMSMPEAT